MKLFMEQTLLILKYISFCRFPSYHILKKKLVNTYISEKMGLKQKIQREATAILFCKYVLHQVYTYVGSIF